MLFFLFISKPQIEMDFQFLYPESSLKLHSVWETFIQNTKKILPQMIKGKYAQRALEIAKHGQLFYFSTS